MKSQIFMYLFLFALLLVLFQYANQKSIFGSQENKIERLKAKVENQADFIEILESENRNLNYFTLMGNDNAMSYFENFGIEAEQVESMVANEIYAKNSTQNDNPLVPYAGMEGVMKINKIRFLNHKWLIADFTDGVYWGEMLIQYDLDEHNELSLHTLSTFLYLR